MPSFRPVILLCAAAVLLTCTACTPTQPARPSGTPPDLSSTSAPEADKPAPSLSTPEAPPPDDEASVPAIFVPEDTSPQPPPAASEEPASVDLPVLDPPPAAASALEDLATVPPQPPEQEPEPSQPSPPEVFTPAYDFSQPVPESEAVESDYFADAAFVGDSRSEGFYLYGVKRGKNLSASGLSVFTFAEKKTLTIGTARYTALEALSLKEYAKVYLGFGVNELGYINTDAFYRAYCDTIDAVRACQPRAVIYAQTMAPVNESRVDATGGAKHLNNDRVQLYNDLIRKAALEKQVPLLDVFSALAVDGSLPADASRDGIHLTGDYCRKQLEYLKTHTVSFDTLYSPSDTETEVLPNETPDGPVSDPVPDSDADGLLPEAEQSPLPTGGDPAASVQ